MNWMVWVVLEIWNMKTIMKYELDGVGDMKYEDKKLWKYELDGVGVGDISKVLPISRLSPHYPGNGYASQNPDFYNSSWENYITSQ